MPDAVHAPPHRNGLGVGGESPGITRLPADVLGMHLWVVDLPRFPGQAAVSCLSPAELTRAARFVFERDRLRFRAAHTALRELLGRYLSVPARDLQFVPGPHGKPALPPPRPCSFNLSHSEEVALIGIAGSGDIGVDVEVLKPLGDAPALAQLNFTPDECRALEGVSEEVRARAFLAIWTRKEACLKALGSGLSIAPTTFGVGVGEHPVETTIPVGDVAVGVRVVSLDLGPDRIGAVARLTKETPDLR